MIAFKTKLTAIAENIIITWNYKKHTLERQGDGGDREMSRGETIFLLEYLIFSLSLKTKLPEQSFGIRLRLNIKVTTPNFIDYLYLKTGVMSKPTNKFLPTSVLIVTAKWIWRTLWKTMMSQLAPSSSEGSYQRPSSQFRHRISQEKDALYSSEAGRYRLYAGMSCPWAHRTLIVRALKGLENAIDVTIVVPSVNQGGWVMTEASENCLSLKQLYQLSQSNYQGRCTVPVLWDTKTKMIVNNESAEIILILNEQFNQFASNPEINLYPEALRTEIEVWNEKIYRHINNGVYRCGFAQTQSAYEEACRGLFNTLDEIELHLQDHAYLSGEQITLADVRLFTTLIRFDLVYYSLFKCSIRRISDYPHLKRYVNQIDHLPKIKDTYNITAIKQDYFGNLFPLNPSGIIPLGDE